MSWDYFIHASHGPCSFAMFDFSIFCLLFQFFVCICWYVLFFIYVTVFSSVLFSSFLLFTVRKLLFWSELGCTLSSQGQFSNPR